MGRPCLSSGIAKTGLPSRLLVLSGVAAHDRDGEAPNPAEPKASRAGAGILDRLPLTLDRDFPTEGSQYGRRRPTKLD